MADTRSLDSLDPPPWGSAPPDATFLVERCHELRLKPIDDFTVEDLRLMVGQGIALPQLVPLALHQLRTTPLAAGDYFPGDLLMNVLRIEASFWRDNPKLVKQLREVIAAIPADITVDRELGERIAAFRQSKRP